MSVLLDSDILIEVLRGRDAGIIERWRLLAQSTETILSTPVSACELWCGARSPEAPAIEALFSALICPPIDAAIGRSAGEFMKRYGPSHGVEMADAMIAATAIRHGAALWTRNRKHYPMREILFY